MFNWFNSGKRTGKICMPVLGWDKNEQGMSPWQYEIADPVNQPMLFGKLYNLGAYADVIIFGRCETQWALNTVYAMRDQFPGKPILAEIDDDITDVAAYNPAADQLKPGSPIAGYALAQFKNSDGLIVSTPYLAEVYSEYCKNIYVIPNSVDVQKWDSVPRKKKPGLRIGWIGAGSHSEDLRLLEKVIPEVLSTNRGAKFVFVSSQIPDFIKVLNGVEVIERWAPILKYPEHLAKQDFDIGLAPLVDNKFNRAKSNLRWLEYSALGIPCVASKVGHFKETVNHGVDGYLAEDAKEFAFYINLLAFDAKARRKMGTLAHARIAKDFNSDINIDLYVDAIEDVLSKPVLDAPSTAIGTDDMKFLAEPPLGPLEMLPEAAP